MMQAFDVEKSGDQSEMKSKVRWGEAITMGSRISITVRSETHQKCLKKLEVFYKGATIALLL